MKAMIPRFGVLLLTTFLAGCGLELLSPLQKLSTSSGSGGIEYSWPVDLALPLGTVSLSLDDPAVARSVFGDLAVLPGNDDRLHLAPASQVLEPIRLAENLVLNDALALDLPERAIPEVDASLSDIAFPAMTLNASEIFGEALAPGQLVPLNLRYSIDSKLPLPPDGADFTEARVGTPPGHLTFTLVNHSGIRMAPTVKLYAAASGATRELGRTPTAVPMDPGESRVLTIPLTPGATLTRDLSLGMEFFVPGGQRVQAPVSHVALTGVTLVSGTISHMRVEIPTRSIAIPPQALDLDLGDPAYEKASVRSLEVDAGTLELTLRNGFPVAATLDLDFPQFFRPGQTAAMTAAYELKAGETRRIEIPLAGVAIRPENGQISVTARATTRDTGKAGALMALDSSQTLSGRIVLQAPLRFRAIEVPVTREVALPATTLPIQLPALVTDQGFRLQDVVLRLDLDNGSGLAGELDLNVQATLPGGGGLLLTDKSGQPIRMPIAANQANALRINALNSNLLDLLDAKPTSLLVSGKVRIDSQGKPVRLAASDQLEGRYGVEIPLSLTIQPFGGTAPKPAIDVRPPTPLTFATQHRDALKRIERAVLKLNLENGWNVPLDLDLLFSASDDPFADADAFVQSVSLGNPTSGFKLNQALTLEGESLERFRQAKMLGMRLRSPGTTEAVSIFRGSRFRVNLGLEFKATVSSQQATP